MCKACGGSAIKRVDLLWLRERVLLKQFSGETFSNQPGRAKVYDDRFICCDLLPTLPTTLLRYFDAFILRFFDIAYVCALGWD